MTDISGEPDIVYTREELAKYIGEAKLSVAKEILDSLMNNYYGGVVTVSKGLLERICNKYIGGGG